MADKLLSEAEVEALLTGLKDPEGDLSKTAQASIRTYDLSNEERITRGRMPSLELVNERFTRLFRIGLYNVFRRNAEISAGQIQIIKYSEFLRHLVTPSNLNLVRMHPFDGIALVVMDPSLVFALVDNYFGGESRFSYVLENREFSQTELRVIQRVLKIAFENLSKAWEPLYAIEFEYLRSEINVQFANITSSNEVVVTCTFNIDLSGSGSGGNLHICMPFSMLEPVRDILRSSNQSQMNPNDNRWEQYMRQEVQRADLELSANLTEIESSLREVVSLNVGDILPIEIPSSLILKAEGVPLYQCQFGKNNGQYALRVENLIYNGTDSGNSNE